MSSRAFGEASKGKESHEPHRPHCVKAQNTHGTACLDPRMPHCYGAQLLTSTLRWGFLGAYSAWAILQTPQLKQLYSRILRLYSILRMLGKTTSLMLQN